jgi:CRISPR-associated endonuclease/helicase Cas3
MLKECYKQVLKNWFGKDEGERKFLDKVIDIMEEKWNRKNIFIIEAPTGYGKSTISASISLLSLRDKNTLKCIVAFPLRALLEDQYCKFVGEKGIENDKKICEDNKKGILGDVEEDLVLKIIGKRYMHNPNSRYLIKPITLTTIDTLALTLFGIPPECIDKVVKAWDGTIGGSLGHYLFSWNSVVLSNIILDEIHLLADSTKSLNFLIALMKIVLDFNQKLIMMSATIPKAFESVLHKYFSNEEIELVRFNGDDDPDFCQERMDKEYEIIFEEISDKDKFNKIIEWIEESINNFSRAIVVFNTVEEAIGFYNKASKSLRKIFNDDEIVLVHSRFSEKDRENKVDKIKKLNKEYRKYLIISTQVIEAGVDISSNLFITDIAPANSLIQRLGRFLRYSPKERPGEKNGKVIIWYEIKRRESNGYKVYDHELVSKTVDWIKNNSEKKGDGYYVNINVHLPEVGNSIKKGYRDLLDYVYSGNCFKMDEKAIEDFEGIFLHLENASLIAISKFFEMEGSFVREEFQVPVVPRIMLDKLKDKNVEDFVRECVIPISIKSFYDKGRKWREKCVGLLRYVMDEKDERKTKIKFIETKIDDWFNKPNSRKILKRIIGGDILAFVIDAKYDEKFGLEVSK